MRVDNVIKSEGFINQRFELTGLQSFKDKPLSG
jgi:hypothetical protein